MEFEQWLIGGRHEPQELTRTLQESRRQYRTRFLYISPMQDSLEIQTASGRSAICTLEEFLERGFASLEMDFLRFSSAVSRKEEMVYLWLRFVPGEESYQLNASLKSIQDQDFLRRRPRGCNPAEEEMRFGFQP